MDSKTYCKKCGRVVVIELDSEDNKLLYKCECTDKPLTRKEVIRGFTRNVRVKQLKAMHELMTLANDEGIYMSWIYTMPDEPSEEDFIDIAMDDEQYNECFDAFVRLIANKDNRY